MTQEHILVETEGKPDTLFIGLHPHPSVTLTAAEYTHRNYAIVNLFTVVPTRSLNFFQGPANHPEADETIISQARQAKKIIACWGPTNTLSMGREVREHQVLTLLRPHPLWCFGTQPNRIQYCHLPLQRYYPC